MVTLSHLKSTALNQEPIMRVEQIADILVLMGAAASIMQLNTPEAESL